MTSLRRPKTMRAIAAGLRLVPAFVLASGICGATALAAGAAGYTSGVTFVPAARLLSGLATGGQRGIALRTYLSAPGYSATLVRRTRAGNAEIHRNVSDVWYVIDGGGTLVTGGVVVGARETGLGELRGAKIAGGTPRRIAKGDFIAIPAGIPHWVSAIDGAQLVYLVVKIKAPTRSK
jgi:mannose-6-phosphate isomerase-like protein (cupin superfamily)